MVFWWDLLRDILQIESRAHVFLSSKFQTGVSMLSFNELSIRAVLACMLQPSESAARLHKPQNLNP